MNDVEVEIADSDDKIKACYDTMILLGGRRATLSKEEFFQQVKRQKETEGYILAYIQGEKAIKAVAGYRFCELLAWGKILYLDDLVTQEEERSKGYGEYLLNWVLEQAKNKGCEEFHLDSGTWRSRTHKFYFKKDFCISGYHFSKELKS